MSNQAQSRGTIAVIGGGVIGRSWTAAFIANGYDVVISDPAEESRKASVKSCPPICAASPANPSARPRSRP